MTIPLIPPALRSTQRQMECEMGQGYHFGRPQSARDLERWMGEWSESNLLTPKLAVIYPDDKPAPTPSNEPPEVHACERKRRSAAPGPSSERPPER